MRDEGTGGPDGEVGRGSEVRTTIIDVVTELLETGGYDEVRLRTVARNARISMTTFYQHFSTRDEAIVAALTRWMDTHVYDGYVPPPPGTSLQETLMWGVRPVVRAWELKPLVFEAFCRMWTGPHGPQLMGHGLPVVEPPVREMLARLDPDYADDVAVIMWNTVYAAIGRFALGQIDIDDILPTIERTTHRITADNAALAAQAVEPQTQRS